MRNIAIIPARSGSKGLPGKNIKLLNGKPLLSYSIEAALRSGLFETVILSTDSEEYAEIGRKYGADVPFLRSKITSSDAASSWDVVEEVLQLYELKGEWFDTFCLLQPTSPLRNEDDIKKAYSLYDEKKAIAVVSLTEVEHPIQWCGQLDETLSLDGFCKCNSDVQRQKMGVTFRPNGAIYVFSVPEFRMDRYIYRDGAYAYIMPRNRSVDIDSDEDFGYAEYLMLKKTKL